ncbi:MAG: NAD-dependent succinate-semialdehyde dehydrogenase [Verrucomicrobia bacterium]|nr:NAD-dependent succinate-semialdehyde dehydrogenase [Verrucomicrobiota bacterium]
MKTYPLYLNGEWVITETTNTVVNPATAEPFARISLIDRSRVARALADAGGGFRSWRATTGKSRGEYLQRIAGELERRRDEVARLITLENGKPLPQSLAEVAMSVDHLRWFAEEARRGYGRVIPNQVEGKRHLAIKTAIGVVGAISPWNFPLVLGVRKVAPALAAGCTVVLKPARQTPLSAVEFAECIDASGLPKGVFQLVAGSASEIGEEFLENPVCRKITFTGSTSVGQILIRGAAQGVKALSLELGGQAPLLVFDDADLTKAVDGAMIAKYRNTGQSCIAANRIYVQRSVYQPFLEQFVAKTKALKVGDGLEDGVQIGPLIDKDALAKAAEHVENAIEQGARLLCGGKTLPGRKGFFFEPTVLADVPDAALCMQEETFAPVAPVSVFDTETEVIERANVSKFGLSAYAFTRDLGRAFRLMESLEAGMIGINDGVPTTSQAPFGGVKQSGWGRELGAEGMEAFLQTKHISLCID